MAKKLKVKKVGKLEMIGGAAKPGPELASFGINMGPFIKEWNDATKDRRGDVVPTVITAFEDRSYAFVTKTTPTARMILKAAGLDKGSSEAPTKIVGAITMAQAKEIAEYKRVDLNVNDIDAATKQVIGTARNMGVEVK